MYGVDVPSEKGCQLTSASAPVWASWPPVVEGWGWRRCPLPLWPVDRSTSHYCTSVKDQRQNRVMCVWSALTVWRCEPPEGRAERATTHFFDVQEVFGIEIDCSSLDGTVLVQSSAVAHIRLDCKRYWFGLEDKSTSEIIAMTLFHCRGFLSKLDKKSKKLQDVSVSRWRHIMLPGSTARGRWSCFDLTYEDFFTSFCSIFTCGPWIMNKI